MKKLITMAVLLIAPVSVSWASALDLSLSDQSANLVYVLSEDPLNRNRTRFGNGGTELGLGVFLNENDDNLYHVSLTARGYQTGRTSQYQFGAAVKLVGGDFTATDEITAEEQNQTAGAFALGFQFGLLIKPRIFNPVDFTVGGFYAPSITSFADAERYTELTARLQLEIIPSARAFVGYRFIRIDTEDFTNTRLDRNAHFGVSFSF